jgi:hypothetical protein
MSTNAVIFVEKPNGKYDGVEVNFDGYIRSATVNRFGHVISWIEGLGWHLNHYWDDYDDILELCKGRNVRSIDGLDVEEYNDTSRHLKNISKDDMEELRHNYCYSYLYAFSEERGEKCWVAGRGHYDGMFFLDLFFDDPDGYENSEDWWDCYG